jgi:hypothetical protein
MYWYIVGSTLKMSVYNLCHKLQRTPTDIFKAEPKIKVNKVVPVLN